MCDTFHSKTVVLQLPKFMNELHCASAARCGIILFVWNACAPRAADIPNFVYIFFGHLLGHTMQASPFIWCALSMFYYPMCIRVQPEFNKAYCCNSVCTEAMYVSPCAQLCQRFTFNNPYGRQSAAYRYSIRTKRIHQPTNQPTIHRLN